MDRRLISTDLAHHGLLGAECDIAIEVVVSAFGWVILHRMGVKKFPEVLTIRQQPGEPVELGVAYCHLFTAALGVAWEVFEYGYTEALSKEGVTAIITSSGEVGAVTKALEDDPSTDLSKASLRTSFLGFEVDDFVTGVGYTGLPVDGSSAE